MPNKKYPPGKIRPDKAKERVKYYYLCHEETRKRFSIKNQHDLF